MPLFLGLMLLLLDLMFLLPSFAFAGWSAFLEVVFDVLAFLITIKVALVFYFLVMIIAILTILIL